MDSKSRVIKTVSKQVPDRLPAFCGRIDDLEHFLKCFGVGSENELREMWGLDCQKTKYNGIFKTQPGRTIWGAEDDWDAGYSSSKAYPLCEAEDTADVEKYGWPNLDHVLFDEISKRIAQLDQSKARIVSVGFTAPFCVLCDLFGMENTMANMHLEPGMMKAALERIEHFMYETVKRVLEKDSNNIDFFWLGDDFSTQRGIMIAPEMWREFLKPVYLKMFELIKSFNVRVWFHSCGTFEPVIGELVDGGMDVWETVQAHLVGNDPESLKKRFGKNLSYFGSINCQKTLPFGTPEDVRREVRQRFDTLGRGGGLIIGPDHSIQKNMPPQNIEALFDEARKCVY